MNIEQKLKQSECSHAIYFFRERMFAQLYGLSLYLAITELNLNIKVFGKRYKNLNNRLILKAGLPITCLEDLYKEKLAKQHYGYELKGNWQVDWNHYLAWQENQLLSLLHIESSKPNKSKCKTKQLSLSITTNQKVNDRKALAGKSSQDAWHLMLSEQEYLFLKNWKQGRYSQSIESQFIKGLSKKIASSCTKSTGAIFLSKK